MTPPIAAVGVPGGWLDRLLRVALGADGGDLVTVRAGQRAPGDADVLVTMTVDRSIIEPALGPAVRWVHVLATGVDGFPFDLLDGRPLTCSRGASSVAIAEFTLALMLDFEKHLPEVWVTEPPAQWNQARLGGLSGRSLGLLGLGAIAAETARRALAFDMSVAAVRRRPGPSPVVGVTVVSSLHQLLAGADHVVVAAPATPETSRLIGRAAFAAMRQGVHFVNVSRGTLVDQDALLDALDAGHVARASLDVVDPEPLPAGHPLYGHPRVRLSPHVSWSAPDTMRRTVELFAEEYRRFRSGEPLQGAVDVAAEY